VTTADGERLRAFLAVEVPEAPRPAVLDLVRRLKERVDGGIRWVRDDSLHLTLRFFGWTDRPRLDAMREPLAAAARACGPFAMGFRGVGMFPERGRPRVLWVGLELPAQTFALQEACERIAVGAGFPPERRAFQPHLTLGRWKDGGRRPVLPLVTDLGRGTVDHLVLFRSELKPSGAVYTPLDTFPLG
jgi:2'-5' RNA ligase